MSAPTVRYYKRIDDSEQTTVVAKHADGDILIIETTKTREGLTTINQITLDKTTRAKIDWLIGSSWQQLYTSLLVDNFHQPKPDILHVYCYEA